MKTDIINWLLNGDPSIRYQAIRDLCSAPENELIRERNRIETEGWGAIMLAKAKPEGGWGSRYYQPKWISTHYTLLDLKNLGINSDIPIIHKSIDKMFRLPVGLDGGINIGITVPYSDVCVNGMMLNIASFFRRDEGELKQIIDYLLKVRMNDGAWNCEYYRGSTRHSSLHTTIGVLEGLNEFIKSGYTYRTGEIKSAMDAGHEFILEHRLYKSDKTGEVIDKRMTMLSYPSRWKYDILRALDYFQYADVNYDIRMQDAIDIILAKRRSDGTWPVQAKHAGQVHFDMEKTGGPSRWNTLRSLRVLKYYMIG